MYANVVNILTEKLIATKLWKFASVYLFIETVQRVQFTLILLWGITMKSTEDKGKETEKKFVVVNL